MQKKGPTTTSCLGVEVSIAGERIGGGQGRSKKEAQQMAAKDALQKLGNLGVGHWLSRFRWTVVRVTCGFAGHGLRARDARAANLRLGYAGHAALLVLTLFVVRRRHEP